MTASRAAGKASAAGRAVALRGRTVALLPALQNANHPLYQNREAGALELLDCPFARPCSSPFLACAEGPDDLARRRVPRSAWPCLRQQSPRLRIFRYLRNKEVCPAEKFYANAWTLIGILTEVWSEFLTDGSTRSAFQLASGNAGQLAFDRPAY